MQTGLFLDAFIIAHGTTRTNYSAGFRSLLDDYEFDFVQGQMPHTEGKQQSMTLQHIS